MALPCPHGQRGAGERRIAGTRSDERSHMFKPRTAVAAACVCAALMAGRSAGQTIIYVNASAPPGGDGTSWATAFDRLEAALAAAPPGGAEVWVAGGVYRPTA